MSVKVTEEALRQFIRKKLSEQSELSGESSPVDMQDVPLEAEDVIQDFEVDLGPPVADPAYMPENIDELKSAVGKLLDDVPESATKTAYKIIKKSLDNLHSVLRQRSEIMPSTALSESSPVERLLLLISEQAKKKIQSPPQVFVLELMTIERYRHLLQSLPRLKTKDRSSTDSSKRR